MSNSQTEMSSSTLIDLLDDLIELNRDAYTGYTTAAEGIDSDVYRQILTDHADERQQFAAELSEIVKQYGGVPPESGNALGALHRAWIQLKNALTSGDRAILAECSQAETVLTNQYKHAVRQPVPADVHDVLTKQMSDLGVTSKKIHDLVAVLDD